MTHFPFVQIMPMVWRVLLWIDHLNKSENIDLSLFEITSVCELRTFVTSHIVLKTNPEKNHLVVNTSCFSIGWKNKYFFFQ